MGVIAGSWLSLSSQCVTCSTTSAYQFVNDPPIYHAHQHKYEAESAVTQTTMARSASLASVRIRTDFVDRPVAVETAGLPA